MFKTIDLAKCNQFDGSTRFFMWSTSRGFMATFSCKCPGSSFQTPPWSLCTSADICELKVEIKLALLLCLCKKELFVLAER